jgi:hypothetical protein
MMHAECQMELNAARRERQLALERNAVLMTRIHRLSEPCKCDPPGSGEEYCTEHCILRAEIARLRAALERIDGMSDRPRCVCGRPTGCDAVRLAAQRALAAGVQRARDDHD